MFPVTARFFRIRVGSYTNGTIEAVIVRRSASLSLPLMTNLGQIAGSAVVANSSQLGINLVNIGNNSVATGGVLGLLAVGGNVAVGAAPSANPLPISGWDGTNTRRILTDAVSGGVALGANGASNGATVSTLIAAGTNNLTQLKSTLGKVHLIDIQNVAVTVRYLKLFNVPSASVTPGTTNATMNFAIPASGKLQIVTDLGINLAGSGIAFMLTTGSALNDNTAVTAGDLICNFMIV
jgi:hypothetical protein